MSYASISEVYGNGFSSSNNNFKQIVGTDNCKQIASLEKFENGSSTNAISQGLRTDNSPSSLSLEAPTSLFRTDNQQRRLPSDTLSGYSDKLLTGAPLNYNGPKVQTRINTRTYDYEVPGTRGGQYTQSLPSGVLGDYTDVYDNKDNDVNLSEVSNDDFLKLYSDHYNKCQYYKNIIMKIIPETQVKQFLDKYDVSECGIQFNVSKEPAKITNKLLEGLPLLIFIGVFLIFMMESFLKLGKLLK